MHYHTLNITTLYIKKQSQIKIKPRKKLTEIGTGTKINIHDLVVIHDYNVHLLSWNVFNFVIAKQSWGRLKSFIV